MDTGGEAVGAAAAWVNSDIPAFLLVGAVWTGFFSWMTVVGWAIQRRKEREAYYRHETEKRLVDKGEVSVEQLIELRREEDRTRWVRRCEGLKLGGLITTALGIGIVVCLPFLDPGEPSISTMGWIPIGIGVVLLLYAYVLYPTFPSLAGGIPSTASDERGPDQQD
ncbi:MAG: hypothetical protein ACYTFA_16190 [Planctomycetota bacterium]|jgi:hypothetical protein